MSKLLGMRSLGRLVQACQFSQQHGMMVCEKRCQLGKGTFSCTIAVTSRVVMSEKETSKGSDVSGLGH